VLHSTMPTDDSVMTSRRGMMRLCLFTLATVSAKSTLWSPAHKHKSMGSGKHEACPSVEASQSSHPVFLPLTPRSTLRNVATVSANSTLWSPARANARAGDQESMGPFSLCKASRIGNPRLPSTDSPIHIAPN